MFSQLFSVKSFGADSSSDSFGMNLWLKNLRLWPEYYGLIRLRYGVIAYAAKCDVMPEYNVMKQLRIFSESNLCRRHSLIWIPYEASSQKIDK